MYCLGCRKPTDKKYCIKCDPKTKTIIAAVLIILLAVFVIYYFSSITIASPLANNTSNNSAPNTNVSENITVGPEPTPEFEGECDLGTRETLRRECISACEEFSSVSALKCGDLAFDLGCEGLYQTAYQCNCLLESDNCETDLVQERICKTSEPCW